MNKQNSSQRYSEEELNEFKQLVERKLVKAIRELELTMAQIDDFNESKVRSGDWMDDTMVGNDYEFLQTLAIRQKKYIRDLENALLRIFNKTYGICVITGEKIDKRRLLAVPTTTKSLTAKMIPIAEKSPKKNTRLPNHKTKVITRVIRKNVNVGIPISEEDIGDLWMNEDSEVMPEDFISEID